MAEGPGTPSVPGPSAIYAVPVGRRPTAERVVDLVQAVEVTHGPQQEMGLLLVAGRRCRDERAQFLILADMLSSRTIPGGITTDMRSGDVISPKIGHLAIKADQFWAFRLYLSDVFLRKG
jgi:hypothetical protein